MTEILIVAGKILTVVYIALFAASVIFLASVLVSYLVVGLWKDVRKWGRARWVAYCREVAHDAELEAQLDTLALAGQWMLDRDRVRQDYRLPRDKHA